MLRVGFQQDFLDGIFRFLIHFADKIIKALVFDRERIQVLGGAVDDLTGAARGLDRGVEHGMHGLSWES